MKNKMTTRAIKDNSNQPHIQIIPPQGWGNLALHEVWKYRELLWFWTLRQIKGRYRQMALGPLWVLLNPIIYMIIFSLVFGGLAKLPSDGVPYPLFTFTALLPWHYFFDGVNWSVNSLVSQKEVMSKIYFPRIILPVSSMLSALIDLAVAFLVLIVLMIYYGIAPSWHILFLPFYVLFAAATGLSVGLWCATVAVRFRDIQFAIQYGLNAFMYATPVAYSASLIPERWLWLYQLNPMYWVIEGWRWSLLGTGQPPQIYMLFSILIVVFLLISGLYIFRHQERTIADWI